MYSLPLEFPEQHRHSFHNTSLKKYLDSLHRTCTQNSFFAQNQNPLAAQNCLYREEYFHISDLLCLLRFKHKNIVL